MMIATMISMIICPPVLLLVLVVLVVVYPTFGCNQLAYRLCSWITEYPTAPSSVLWCYENHDPPTQGMDVDSRAEKDEIDSEGSWREGGKK